MPFVDVLDTMFNDQLPLTKLEYDEWGNPNEPAYAKYIQSYDPIRNLRALPPGDCYPSMYVTASLLDQRVPYWGPFKYVTRMRELNPEHGDVVLEVDTDAGHMGVGGRFGYLSADCRALAFAIDRIGLMKE
jgi:oligopeptidase B